MGNLGQGAFVYINANGRRTTLCSHVDLCYLKGSLGKGYKKAGAPPPPPYYIRLSPSAQLLIRYILLLPSVGTGLNLTYVMHFIHMV